MLVVATQMSISIEGTEAPIGSAEACLEALGDGGRYHVHSAPRGEGAVLHLATSLEYLNGVHAGNIGEVVGGGSGIRGGGCKDPVFHERDTFAALGLGTSQADVWAQAVAIFFVDVHARHGT